MSIGKNIAKYRKLKKITQEELGLMLGVTNQSVSKWESEVSMPDIMLLPQIVAALDITLDDLYGIAKKAENIHIGADEFPEFCYGKLHEMFCLNSRLRVRIADVGETDEEQIGYQRQRLHGGCREGCFSNTQGAVIITDELAFIDRTYKATGSENIIKDLGDSQYILMYLTDRNLRKILAYQYKTAFENSKENNTEFTLEEIMQACCLEECEAVAALHILKDTNINEVYTERETKTKKYVFKMSNAIYAVAIYKLAELLFENDPVWTIVRDTSMISDYTFGG